MRRVSFDQLGSFGWVVLAVLVVAATLIGRLVARFFLRATDTRADKPRGS